MSFKCDLRHYNLDFIPKYRQEFINLRLDWFIKTFDIDSSSWPVDCIKIIKRVSLIEKIPFIYSFVEMSDKIDALSVLKPYPRISPGVYMMLINKNKVRYPYTNSRDRRMNFTIAHELGHIALGHLLVPRENKTNYDLYVEELEAEEFAGRFLMPEKLLYSINYYSLESAAAFFNVSKTALWKRLNNLKRLDLLYSKKVPTCKTCGNTEFSHFAQFCKICGESIHNNLNGILRVNYPKIIKLDRYKRVIECPFCHSSGDNFINDKCSICGTYIFNYCTDLKTCTYANPGNARFCETCGRPTYYYQKNFFCKFG